MTEFQYEPVLKFIPIQYLHCNTCGKQVSEGFTPIYPDKKLDVRAWIECPECIEKKKTEG